MNRLRLRYGLAPLGLDLRRVYTDADYTLYADLPDLVPIRRLPPTHGFLGPINWSPRIATPSWWKSLPAGQPLIYVTLGSSGQSALLPVVVQALAPLAVTVILATAGRGDLSEYPGNVLVSDYLPGDEAARLANLVICNGGSPTTYQALSEGKPVIGIASNMDQYLNMSVVQRVGAGRLIRSGLLSSALLRQTVETALCDSAMKEAAQRVKGMIDAYPAGERFASWLRRAVDEHDDRSGRR
jgi:UDP:flavonoid glycosyltransferase YjiC (YdhE family)